MLAACGGGKRDTDDKTEVLPAPAPAAPRAQHPPTASHGSTIVHIAVTEDGRAAISSDQQGALRLWPVLDGTREPVVLRGAEPAGLAIARDGDGFVVADHDAASGVELIRVGPGGDLRGRAALGRDPEVLQVELVGGAALVLRADRVIEIVAFDGTVRTRLVPEPGTRTRSLIARAGRVLALLDVGSELRGRWIDVEATRATWGARTRPLPFDPTRAIAMSPDHRRLVGSKPGASHTPLIVDLASDTAGLHLMCVLADAQPDPFKFDSDDILPTALGFVDARTVACATNGLLSYWGTNGEAAAPTGPEITTVGVEHAFGDGVVVAGLGHQLGLYTPRAVHYLGYGFRELTNVRVVPTGLLIGKGDHKPILLDAALRERARFALPVQAGDWTDLVPLDDRYLLTVSTRPMSADAWGNAYQVSVYDAVTQSIHQLLPNRAAGGDLVYEPATQLLVSSDGGKHLLLRFDPRTHSFGARTELATTAIVRRIQLTDPAISDGLAALALRDADGAVLVDELGADDVTGATIAARASFRIAGELRAVDRAGQLYVHGPTDGDAITVVRHGIVIAKLAGAAPLALRPSPDGATVAGLGSQRIALYSTTGTLRWQAAAWGATDVLWALDGALIARYAGALATLDPTTGELAQRQCGWGFGLAETPFETSTTTPNVCDAR